MILLTKNFKAPISTKASPGILGLVHPFWLDGQWIIWWWNGYFVKFKFSTKGNPIHTIIGNHETHLILQILKITKENGVLFLRRVSICLNPRHLQLFVVTICCLFDTSSQKMNDETMTDEQQHQAKDLMQLLLKKLTTSRQRAEDRGKSIW